MIINSYRMYTLLERAKNRIGHDGFIELNAIFNNAYREKRSKEIFASVFFLGVKAHRYVDRDLWEQVDPTERFKQMERELLLLQGMTPRQLLNVFPIDKVYDKTGEIKDYFTTMKFIEGYGMDRRIDDVLSFLWDYSNGDLRMYLLDYMTVLSDLEKKDGKPSLMEQFLFDGGMTND